MKNSKNSERLIFEKFGLPNDDTCKDCGSMKDLETEMCTNEGCDGKKMKESKSKWLSESKKIFLEVRDKVSEMELVQTWEDLFVESGSVSLEELASWLNATPQAVQQSMPSWLVVDKQGNVVEMGGLHEAPKEIEIDYIPPKKKATPKKASAKKKAAPKAAVKKTDNDYVLDTELSDLEDDVEEMSICDSCGADIHGNENICDDCLDAEYEMRDRKHADIYGDDY